MLPNDRGLVIYGAGHLAILRELANDCYALHLTRSRGYLSESQARAFYEKLQALILEFEGSIESPGESDGKYVLTMTLFPEKRPSSQTNR
jgi:hypothetical protein